MSTVDDVYAALRDSPDRGIAFEKLMVRYFGLHPTLRQEYDQVCRWTDWEYNGGRPDTGVDLVAHRREDDSWTAVQCKFYESTTTLSKGDLDSFFTASGQGFDTPDGHRYFTNRIIISTTDRWGRNAEAAIEDQAVPVQRFGLAEIAEAPIDWDIAYPGSGAPVVVDMRERQRFALRPHQREAVDKVLAGFRTHDRGQLIMACGTGKTFTALRLAEEWAENNGGRARVLFCVPSLSLLAQSMREWTTHAELDLRCFAVCSDTKVTRAAEDIATYDLEIPVTTDGATLAERLRTRRRAAGLSVVFATYQSLQAVHGAQELGADDFDLVLCDEAHRTTGVTLAGEDPGQFVRVHDPEYIRARHRLYMTATPRLYDDEVKGAAAEHSAELASMDDEAVFGPEFHRLGFSTAVESGLLTDYRVLVLTVDQELAAAATQDLVEDDGTEIRLDDVARLIGCWNGLAGGFDAAARPMQRAVAFAVDIRASRRVAETFPRITAGKEPEVDARHVDGTMNALERGRLLQWLTAPVPDGECRVLTNARCLSEGVDVPALDAVMFLNPRSSTVDVVQSVGRVMRRSPDKDYGYIILPVGVPAGTSPAEALKDNRRFRVVWQVLNALRAHDERFNAVVNSVALEGREALQDTLRVDHLGEVAGGDDTDADAARQLALFSVEQWREAVYTRVVEKVGDRAYWEDWSADVADIASAQVTRIREILATAGPGLRARFDDFLAGLRANLNDAVTEDEAVSMLSQHLITAPVFDALFGDSDFARRNPVSRVMDGMVRALDDRRLESETEGLARFYESVRARASAVTSASGKQQVVKDLYERFFRTGFPRQADKLGIVYTPVEVVDFILRAADHVLREHFGRGLTDRNVHVQDPFTGTGTFIVRLLQSGLIRPEDLERTYREELWATEIMLLAYYVAAVNIEVTYNGLQAERARRAGLPEPGYAEFPGIVLGDTFQMSEEGDALDLDVFVTNSERGQRQLAAPIEVVVGNPPYSSGQQYVNDFNANIPYPTLDGRIRDTYVRRSAAGNKNNLYDSYVRAVRWATDRIGDRGVVAFVCNGNWIDGVSFDGMRRSLAADFSRVYVYNLRGNTRGAGEVRKKERENVFGQGSQVTVAVLVAVKDPAHTGECEILYHDIGDYLSREEKLARVAAADVGTLKWTRIEPDAYGDWISQRDDRFLGWPVLGENRAERATEWVFAQSSRGLMTGKVGLFTAFSAAGLRERVAVALESYRAAQAAFAAWCREAGVTTPTVEQAAAFLAAHPGLTGDDGVSWHATLTRRLARGVDLRAERDGERTGLYRPFAPRHVYLSRDLNLGPYKIPALFPTPRHPNTGFYIVPPGSPKSFSALATARIPDLALWGSYGGQFFPRWTWEPVDGTLDLAVGGDGDGIVEGYRRVDNITDGILRRYRDALGGDVTKDDIFHLVYAQLHDPAYREAYRDDLRKVFPHIPTPETRERFDRLVAAGRRLLELHVGYEDVDPHPLDVQLRDGADPADPATWRVTSMRWRSRTDHTAIVVNPSVTVAGIPPEAEEYVLGSRTALSWVIEQWKVTTDKATGRTNDPNDWAAEQGDPRYIVDLIGKVTRVAVETVRIVGDLATG